MSIHSLFGWESLSLRHDVQKNTHIATKKHCIGTHLLEPVPLDGDPIMIWGFFSYDSMYPQVTVRDKVLVPHFDNHYLLTRSFFMDDNAIPYRTSAVVDFLRLGVVAILTWPARSPILSPKKHILSIVKRTIRQRDPPVHSIGDLDQALHQEWNRLA